MKPAANLHASLARTSRRLRLAAWLCASFSLPGHALAQAFPVRPISMVVPFPAGGATDAAARVVANHLTQALGQAVAVENVSGASGAIAAQKVARAQPDGYTLLAGTINDVVLAPILNRGTAYKYQDFAPIGEIGVTPFVLVANAKLPATQIDELLTHARKHPGKLNVGIPGVGTLQHIAVAMLGSQAKLEWSTVPYKGAAPLTADLLGGQIDLAVVTLPSAVQYIQDGKLKSLGLMSLQREERYRDLPTINEGREIKGLSTDAWIGLLAPAKTPPEVVERLSAALQDTLKKPEAREALSKLGYRTAVASGPAEFGRFMAREDARYRQVAHTVKLDR